MQWDKLVQDNKNQMNTETNWSVSQIKEEIQQAFREFVVARRMREGIEISIDILEDEAVEIVKGFFEDMRIDEAEDMVDDIESSGRSKWISG
jgi:hypothetical protein|tara:strand:- start:76 stop:351 length:276 start_codon:yes stop_codon:yes gene_type:complete